MSFCTAKEPPLKANLFLSFQTIQKMHNGMNFQIFFLFFPTKGPLRLINLFYCLWEDPLKAKQDKDNVPKNSDHYTMYKYMIYSFFLKNSSSKPC